MNENKVLEVKELSVLMKERFLVKDINFSMEAGECYGIVGEDKSGKTSLIKTLSGSLPISSGQVFVCGQNIVDNKYILKDVSICLDPPMFFKYQSVYENLKYLSSLSGTHTKQDILSVLKKFSLEHRKRTKVFYLSYYEKKLMALALAFLTEPKLLLLDEPFKGLPEKHIEELKKHIKEIRALGTSVIMTSRNLESIEASCDKIIFMENKTIKEIMTKEQCKNFDEGINFAFVAVKYPHYAGKLAINNFNLDVKLLGNKVLFDADEDLTADIVKFFSKNKIEVYKAGHLSKKAEKIFASLTPYFKEEQA